MREPTPVEAALLGSVLIRPAALPELLDTLGEDGSLFADRRYGLIWATAVALWREGTPVDMISLGARLERDGLSARTGGYATLGALYEHVASSQHAPSYATAIAAEHQRRRLQRTLRDLLAASETGDPATLAAEALSALTQVAPAHHGAQSLAGVLEHALTQWQRGPAPRLTTGLPPLDQILGGGFAPGQLIYLAAQTSRGKTALALHLATHAAQAHGAGTVIFSLEMTADELAARFLAPPTGASASVLTQQVHADAGLHARTVRAAGALSNLPIWVQDASLLHVDQVCAEVYRLHAQHGLGLVVVDYLGLLRKPDARQSRNDWLGDVSQRLKGLAKDCGLPVLALSQLSRESVRGGATRPPELHDLRDSGNLEQDANVVLMLHRSQAPQPHEVEIDLDLFVRKNRGGPLGTVPVRFRLATGAFTA